MNADFCKQIIEIFEFPKTHVRNFETNWIQSHFKRLVFYYKYEKVDFFFASQKDTIFWVAIIDFIKWSMIIFKIPGHVHHVGVTTLSISIYR